MSGSHAAVPAAYDVVLACLTQTPEPEAAAALVVSALRRYGHLRAPEPTPADVEEYARWLAEVSGHPRYGGDRWRTLLAADGDVVLAANAAAARHPDEETRRQIAESRRVLLAALQKSVRAVR